MKHKRCSYRLLLLLFTLLTLTLSACSFPAASKESGKEQASFDSFTNREFCNLMKENTISLHYTIKNPDQYGISAPEPTLGSLDIAQLEAEEAESLQTLKELEQFSYDSLTSEQKTTYNALHYTLKTAQKAKGLSLYQNILSPVSGLQSQLPVLLAEYYFDTEQDIKDYLTLLGQMDSYFSQILTYEQVQSQKGLFMSDISASNVIQQCQDFIKNPDQNMLITSFDRRIEEMNTMTPQLIDSYKQKNREQITASVIPAYQNLIKGLTALKGTGVNDGGLSQFPEGRKYYEFLVQYSTGSKRPISAIIALLDQRMETLTQDLQTIATSNPDALTQLGNEDYGLTDPSQIVENLKKVMQTQYPEAPAAEYQIKTVDKSLAPSLSPAFYLIPPIDAPQQNAIYINSLNSSYDPSSLFPTLAHEGYPGHMYQNTYYLSTTPNPLRTALSFGGYSEGWATYVEYHIYELATFSQNNPDLAKLLQINMELNFIICCRVDIGVNHQSWDAADTKKYLNRYGIGNQETADSIRQAVIEDPANYLKYYIGFLEFEELRTLAQNKLGSKFNLITFHQTILDLGPASFQMTADAVNSYIDQNR